MLQPRVADRGGRIRRPFLAIVGRDCWEERKGENWPIVESLAPKRATNGGFSVKLVDSVGSQDTGSSTSGPWTASTLRGRQRYKSQKLPPLASFSSSLLPQE